MISWHVLPGWLSHAVEPSGPAKDITESVGVEGGNGKSMECVSSVLRLAVQGVLDAPSLASRGR